MSVPRTRDVACDLTVQPRVSTLHIPASHTFIPFQQFAITDGSGIRNPADDNNNKTAVPVVSVVTAVSGLCPAIPVVSMHQTAQLAQAVVTPTIIPAVVTPMTVQTANCLTPTTTMTVANTLNIGNHISLPVQHQTVNISGISVSAHQPGPAVNISGISVSAHQPGPAVNAIINSTSITNHQQKNITPTALNKSSSVCSNSSSNNSPPSATNAAKPTCSTSNNISKPSSAQGVANEQNEDLVKPVFKDGELVLEVECGQNKAILYLSKLCQGSKGPCISFQSSWLTPNEFQFVSGRETAKDWKRSIRHHGKSLKLLLAKGILNVHPTMCDCDGCRQGATLTRKGEKRRIPNGERKPRKPSSASSNVGSDGNSTGAFRLLGSSTMAAHLTPPGATQAKPEVKRSGIDKSKMADTTAPSSSSDNTPKAGPRPSALQRPSSLNTSRDCIKSKPTSSTLALTSPLLAAAASTSPTTPGKLNPTPGQVTPSRVQPYPSASVFSNSSTVTSPVSNSLLVASLPTPLAAALSSTVAEGDQPMGYATNPEFSNTQSPSLQNNRHPFIQSSSKDCDLSESADEESEDHSKTDQDMFSKQPQTDLATFDNEDHAVSNDTDESQHVDDKSEMFDDCDVSSDGSSFRDSDNSNCSSSDQLNDGGFDNDNSLGESAHVTEQQDVQDSANSTSDCPGVKEDLDVKESVELTPLSETPVADVSSDDKYNPALSIQAALTATLAVSTMSGTYSQPLFVSVSSNNVKSEHIWVPPRLSPPSQPQHSQPQHSQPQHSQPQHSQPQHSQHQHSQPQHSQPQHNQPQHSQSQHSQSQHNQPQHSQHSQNGGSAVKTADVLTPTDRGSHFKPDDHHMTYDQSRNSDKQNISKKPEPVSQPRELQQSKEFQLVQQLKELPQAVVKPDDLVTADSHVTGTGQTKEFESIERHLAVGSENDRSDVRREACQGTGPQDGFLRGSEKSNTDKEREEKYRQKVKEERNRKEREERNRKDREREERRERERREEKDSERRRHEEKERREMVKAHAEANSSKENTSGDHSRRPPGGVAEAAAFSDYMRVLAAGHAHPFMSPSLSYMSSLFPVRPQEASLQAHLLHPMSAFGSQLSGLPKDHMIYQTVNGMVPNFGGHAFGAVHPVLQRHSYTTQQSLLDYQRSLSTAAAYPWPTAYPYFMTNVTAASSASSSATAAVLAAGMKRPSSDIEAAMEMNAKRMRMEGRPPEYTSPWDYFAAAAAASQHQRATAMAPSLPCGLESASMDKTAEYLRKRYMEYGPQGAAYLSTLPEYSRTPYQCACVDHRDDNVMMWSVEDVCKFVSSLDGCAIYADHFREQRVTGRILALLTTDHFVKVMGMKLGPAILLAEAVAKKMQDSTKMYSCEACRSIALSQPMHPMALPL